MHSPRRWSLLTLVALCAVTFSSIRASARTDITYVPPTPKRTLLVVGDSLTVGADSLGDLGDKLTSQRNWSIVRVDAAVGRKIPRGIEIVKQQMLRNPWTGGFIVALGTNDLLSSRSAASHAGDAELLLKAAKGRPVLWVNVTYASWREDWVTKALAFGLELRKLAVEYPNLTIASWYKYFSRTSPFWSPRDGIHLSTTGYRTRATFIATSASTWWKKVTTPSTTTTLPPSTSSSVEPPPTDPPAESTPS